MLGFKNKKTCRIFLCGMLLVQSVAGQIKGITDGPYIFYRSGKIIVKSVIVSGDTARPLTDSSRESGRSSRILKVHLDKHPEWDFTVRLKEKIGPRSPIFSGADKTLVLSDIEGEFEPFRNLLLAANVINTGYNWTFGKGRLIVAGDLFDRGKQVCQFLWLLYKLEDESKSKGGDVNVVLGNHDIMNLSGDYRYVQPEYYFNAKLLNENYSNLYAPSTELGRWLRSKNIIEKIGGLLVLHGGVSPAILNRQLSIQRINDNCRPYFDADLRNIPDSLKDFFNDNALFWYRGYFLEPKASQGLVDSTLAFYQCKKIVVGHDIIDHIASFYNDKLIGVDVDEHEGTHEALLIIGTHYYRVDDKDNRTEL
jgi:hypothetical protein